MMMRDENLSYSHPHHRDLAWKKIDHHYPNVNNDTKQSMKVKKTQYFRKIILMRTRNLCVNAMQWRSPLQSSQASWLLCSQTHCIFLVLNPFCGSFIHFISNCRTLFISDISDEKGINFIVINVIFRCFVII